MTLDSTIETVFGGLGSLTLSMPFFLDPFLPLFF